MSRVVLIGLWVLAIGVGVVAVVKNSGDGGPQPHGRRAVATSPTSRSTPSTTVLSPDPTMAPTPTVQTENDVLDRVDGVAPPGATRWDDFAVYNQAPGVDVAVAPTLDGSGAMAFFAFDSDEAATTFAGAPPLHLAGIGDYNATSPVPAPPGLPAGSEAFDLRTCSGGPPPGVAVGPGNTCADGGPTHSSGALVVAPLDNFALVTTAWTTTPGGVAAATMGRAVAEASEALAYWSGIPK
ncbi:MAG: hypothetical protein JO086_05115 [Acidimicrobiia bacterium]|nr:hypothetical protein [Acidimicrobiia bacterium]